MKSVKNIDRLEVFLEGAKVGTLVQGNRRTAFQYDEAFIRKGIELSPQIMPLSNRVYVGEDDAFDHLPALFADSLPDQYGREIMNNWFFKEFDIMLRPGPLDMLAYVGENGMGALTYAPAYSLEHNEVVRTLDLRAQQKAARDLATNQPAEWIEMKRRGTHTVGGSYAKVLAAEDPSTGELYEEDARLAPDFRHWIIKFATPHGQRTSMANYPEIECAYNKMAGDCGIRVPSCRLFPSLDEKGEPLKHVGIERFDSVAGRRVHMASFAGLSGIPARAPRDYRDLFTLTASVTRDMRETQELYRRMVFNVVLQNLDDHGKNHAFLLEPGNQWVLSPAYDLTFTAHLTEEARSVHIKVARAMSVGGKSHGVTCKDMEAMGQRAGLEKSFCREVIDATITVAEKASDYIGEMPEKDAAVVLSSLRNQVGLLKRQTWQPRTSFGTSPLPSVRKPDVRKSGGYGD